MMKPTLLAAIALLTVTPWAVAQEQPLTAGSGAGSTEMSSADVALTIDPYANHQFRTTIKDSGGTDMAVTRAGTGVNIGLKVAPQLTLNLGLLAEYSRYQFDNIPGVLGVEKRTLHAMIVRVAPGLDYRISDTWAIFGGVTADFSGEMGASGEKTDTYGGFLGVRYKYSKDLSLVVGVAAREGLEDHGSVTPMIGVNWQITEDLRLTTSGANLGAEVKLTKSFGSDWSLSLATGYESRAYRLDDRAPVVEGILREARVPMTVALECTPLPGLKVRLDVGAVVFQRMQVDDRVGNELFHREANCSPFTGVSASYRF